MVEEKKSHGLFQSDDSEYNQENPQDSSLLKSPHDRKIMGCRQRAFVSKPQQSELPS